MAIAGKTLKFSEILSALPPSPETSLIGEIRGQVERNGKKIVMLDDDPTGTQTVYDTPVLTDWSISSLTQIFAEPGLLFCILTNSRSLSAEVASRLMIEIIQTRRGQCSNWALGTCLSAVPIQHCGVILTKRQQPSWIPLAIQSMV